MTLPAVAPPAPSISVVCAFFNEAAVILDAVKSLNEQTFRNFEVVFIDDASSDGSAEIIKTHANFPYRILHNDCNLGLAASLNRGVAAATGTLIARHDADDVMLPDRLGHQMAFFADADLVLLGGQAQKIDDHGTPFGSLAMPCSDRDCRFALNFYPPFVHPAVMYRKADVEAVGGYDAATFPAEDYDLWCRLAGRGRIGNTDHTVLKYRVRSSGSITSDRRQTQLRKHAEVMRRYRFFGAPSPRGTALHIRRIFRLLTLFGGTDRLSLIKKIGRMAAPAR
jgi:glycosyltransferase EpsE